MPEDTTIALYMISIGLLLAISLACSMTKNGFSTPVFMVSLSIGIGILIWLSIFPFYMIVISGLMIIGMLFMNNSGDDSLE